MVIFLNSFACVTNVFSSQQLLPRGVDRQPTNLKVGDEMHGFKVLDISEFQEFKATAYQVGCIF